MGVHPGRSAVRAVLFDRDGTLIEDVPYNGDPARVRLLPGARDALDTLRLHGVRTGVVTNQSGVGRGLLTIDQVHTVNTRVEELLGRFSTWQICPHRPDDGCSCRKPRPGLVLAACATLGVEPADTVLIGDTGADVEAALGAGARPILVPNPVTLRSEIDAAPVVVDDLQAAARTVLAEVAA